MLATSFAIRPRIRLLDARALWCAAGCLALWFSSVGASAAEAKEGVGTSAIKTCASFADLPVSAYPVVARGCGEELAYVGAYLADGRYYRGDFETAVVQEETQLLGGKIRPADVPGGVDLHGRERLVKEFRRESPAAQGASGRSRWAEWRDDLITAVYGHEKTIVAPQSVAIDWAGRVIVSDPAGGVVHVLDRVRPFRIAVGPQYRLRHAGAVAADTRNNIFVADPVEGIVVEFDASGRFVREIGRIGENEGTFYSPAGLHVDESDLLYVADAGRDMLLVLDTDGRLVKKAGGKRMEMGVSFAHPTAVAASDGRIAVVDSDGTRVQVLDKNCRRVESFETGVKGTGLALDLDSAGNIYLSSAGRAKVRVYSPAGALRGEFGRHGLERGELQAANGIAIDANDRLYVSDAENRRVDVFQIEWLK